MQRMKATQTKKEAHGHNAFHRRRHHHLGDDHDGHENQPRKQNLKHHHGQNHDDEHRGHQRANGTPLRADEALHAKHQFIHSSPSVAGIAPLVCGSSSVGTFSAGNSPGMGACPLSAARNWYT